MEELIAWAAGFVDGEGSLDLKRGLRPNGKPVFRPRLVVGNIRREPLDRLQDLFGGNVRLRRPAEPTRRPLAAWELTGRRLVAPALRSMLPYLTVKRREAELLLAFMETMGHGGPSLTEDEVYRRDRLRARLAELKAE